ncbi:polyprenyl synthetase family protein [Aureimonas leprariae]|uniref:Geranylgeranyl pyrophosphate synthase n=1 Tax=Plantimonas leprariae TaxID=2615207 RepID=A0A7V7PQD4_9HYPH|nr:polyprenyl synthetase family protein [Aureimonas leprariae]KAB0680315.1 geranylgeranyl pyrophosphate synthase [Aureimonas leprariae]
MAGDELSQRIENALRRALARVTGAAAPPRLAAACEASVFPAGQRIRPRLALSVALACGDDRPLVANAAAVAVELLHCASLVHDDMPCFDDAALRRGRPSVHAAHGEALALLAGDALIVLAFETVALAAAADPLRAASLSLVIARAVGMPNGIVAGQGWESEPDPDLGLYQRAKTGALFAGAAQAGAVAAGAAAADAWGLLGYRLGEAYQVADDIRDVMCSERTIGKPVGRDEALGRPNAVRELGLRGAALRLKSLVEEATDGVPVCPGADALKTQIRLQASRFLPEDATQYAA